MLCGRDLLLAWLGLFLFSILLETLFGQWYGAYLAFVGMTGADYRA